MTTLRRSLADRVRRDVVEIRDRQMDDTPLRCLQGLEVVFLLCLADTFGELLRLFDQEPVFAAHVTADVDRDLAVATRAPREDAIDDVLDRRERFAAPADQETVQAARVDIDEGGVVRIFDRERVLNAMKPKTSPMMERPRRRRPRSSWTSRYAASRIRTILPPKRPGTAVRRDDFVVLVLTRPVPSALSSAWLMVFPVSTECAIATPTNPCESGVSRPARRRRRRGPFVALTM
jgi:hypothetical protein